MAGIFVTFRRYIINLALLALPIVVSAASPLQWWTETGLVKVMRQDAPGTARMMRLQAARGETEWAQIVLRGDGRQRSVGLSATPLADYRGRPLSGSEIIFHPAVYVHVSLPSGNEVRRPDYWPEVLPVADSVTLPAEGNQPVYVEVRVPYNARSGPYRSTTCLRVGDEAPVEVPLRLTVWPLTVPGIPTTRTSYYAWWEGLQKRFSLTPGTKQWREVMDRFLWFMVDRRLCPMSLPVEVQHGERYLRDPRVNGVRLPYAGTDEEMQQTIAFVKARGWLDQCFYYLYDEPPQRLWHEVWAAANRLHGLDPLTPTLDTIQPEPALQGAVSIWCPNVESVYLSEEAIAQARARGEEVWWYTCCFPKAPYPTFLLDDDAIAPRLLFWSQPRYDLTGSLYINTIHWGPEGNDIWAKAAVSPELLANNDGLIMYTGRGTSLADAHPVTGVRLEMIRDGLEDVELLNLLRQEIIDAAKQQGRGDGPRLAQEHLSALASQIIPDLRHCDRDPQHLLRLREQAARETITLQRHPEALDEILALKPHHFREGRQPVNFEKFCFALPGTPVIDGKLDDECWQRAAQSNRPGLRTTITRFRNLTGRIWPSQETLVHWLYDKDYLYCSFQCGEPEPEKLKTLAAVGEVAKADRVAVGLLPAGEDGNCRQRWYVVTVDGNQLEGEPNTAKEVPQPGWQAKVQREECAYTVEIALPRRLAGTSLQPPFNLFRYVAPGDETLYMTGRFASKESPFEFGRLVLHK